MDKMEFNVDKASLEDFKVAVNSLNKRAAQLGIANKTTYTVDLPKLEKVSLIKRSVSDGHLVETVVGSYDKVAYKVTVEAGDVLKIGDWNVVGMIRLHKSSNGGHQIVERFGEFFKNNPIQDIKCQHCNIKRYRNVTYILRSTENGEIKQVGSGCVKQFTGIDPKNMLSMFESLKATIVALGEDDEEFNAFGCKGNKQVDLLPFIIATMASIDSNGWVSRSKAYSANYPMKSTSDDAWKNFNANYDVGINSYIKEAEKCVEWMQSLDASNSYEYTLKEIGDSRIVPVKVAGYAASAVPAYRKAAYKMSTAASEYVGTLGDKLTIEATLFDIKRFESMYGPSKILLFKSNDNIVVWITSTKLAVRVNDVVELSGTISNHKEFNGSKQTHVKRCKLKKISSFNLSEHSDLETKLVTIHF